MKKKYFQAVITALLLFGVNQLSFIKFLPIELRIIITGYLSIIFYWAVDSSFCWILGSAKKTSDEIKESNINLMELKGLKNITKLILFVMIFFDNT